MLERRFDFFQKTKAERNILSSQCNRSSYTVDADIDVMSHEQGSIERMLWLTKFKQNLVSNCTIWALFSAC